MSKTTPGDDFMLPAQRKSGSSRSCSSSTLEHTYDRGNSAPRRQSVKKVFVDADDLKQKIRASAMCPAYDVTTYYKDKGIWQEIARHPWFETLTLCVIGFNALWISIDTDMNHAEVLIDAHPVFQVAEHSFCLYFSLEWIVRFMAFRRKRDGFRDGWFVFDSILVSTMVFETWVMNIVVVCAGGTGGMGAGNSSILRIARLLRLSRMARMVRLFKAMPELLILIKAMLASLRSCFFVFLLLALIMYIFGITFRQVTAGTSVGDQYFASVLGGMHTLWLDGTLLDNPGTLVTALWDESFAFVLVFYLFVLLSALTVMNMLIGVLCEVVSAVAATEKESLTVNWVKTKLQDLMSSSGLDSNADGHISKQEFAQLLDYPEACKALEDIGVDVFGLIDNIDFIFADTSDAFGENVDKELSFEAFMTLMLELRGTNTATVKDMVELQKFISRSLVNSNRCVRKEMHRSEARMVRRASCVGMPDMNDPHPVAVPLDPMDFDPAVRDSLPGMAAPSTPEAALSLLRLSASSAPPSPWGGSEADAGLKSELHELVHETIMPELRKISTALHDSFKDGVWKWKACQKDHPASDEQSKQASHCSSRGDNDVDSIASFDMKVFAPASTAGDISSSGQTRRWLHAL